MRTLILTLILLAIAIPSQAIQLPADETSKLQLFREATKNSDDNTTIWGIRLLNQGIIGDHKTAIQAMLWCQGQPENKGACDLFIKLSTEAENKTIAAIQNSESMIAHYETLPTTYPQLKGLKEQLDVMKSLPFPVQDMTMEVMKQLSPSELEAVKKMQSNE